MLLRSDDAPVSPPDGARHFPNAAIVEHIKPVSHAQKHKGTRLGRRSVRLTAAQLATVAALPVREAAQQLGVSVNTYQNARRVVCQQTSATDLEKLAQIKAA